MKDKILRIISIILASSIIFGASLTTYATELSGDMNSDGKVNSTDALIILQISVGTKKPDSKSPLKGDMNSDGQINSSDALYLLKTVVGITDDTTSSFWQIIKQGISDSEALQNVIKNIVTVGGSVEWTIDDSGNITTKNDSGKDTGVFGFKYNTNDKIFITAEDPWQRNFGYTEIYDRTSGFGAISYDTIRIKYTYNNKDWMIQLWKGQYGLAFIGAEVGVYNREEAGQDETFYNCVTDDEKLTMEMSVYRGTSDQNSWEYSELFTRSKSTTWWLTGFTPGTLQAGTYVVDEEYTKLLRHDVTIYFDSKDEAKAFISGLKSCTKIEHNAPQTTYRNIIFKKVPSFWYNSAKVDNKYSVSADGKTVSLSWR